MMRKASGDYAADDDAVGFEAQSLTAAPFAEKFGIADDLNVGAECCCLRKL